MYSYFKAFLANWIYRTSTVSQYIPLIWYKITYIVIEDFGRYRPPLLCSRLHMHSLADQVLIYNKQLNWYLAKLSIMWQTLFKAKMGSPEEKGASHSLLITTGLGRSGDWLFF